MAFIIHKDLKITLTQILSGGYSHPKKVFIEMNKKKKN